MIGLLPFGIFPVEWWNLLKAYFLFCFGATPCTLVSSPSLLRAYSWRCSGTGHAKSNMDWLCVRQAPYLLCYLSGFLKSIFLISILSTHTLHELLFCNFSLFLHQVIIKDNWKWSIFFHNVSWLFIFYLSRSSQRKIIFLFFLCLGGHMITFNCAALGLLSTLLGDQLAEQSWRKTTASNPHHHHMFISLISFWPREIFFNLPFFLVVYGDILSYKS